MHTTGWLGENNSKLDGGNRILDKNTKMNENLALITTAQLHAEEDTNTANELPQDGNYIGQQETEMTSKEERNVDMLITNYFSISKQTQRYLNCNRTKAAARF
jgi:hypothetical protein